jgi:hypothetical protein
VSTKQHREATLGGYDGPFFPASLKELRRQLDVRMFGGSTLVQAGQAIEGYTDVRQYQTRDGYDWYRGLRFESQAGLVLVLIPWSLDQKKAGGTLADRSIAVHTRRCSEDEVDRIVQELARAIERLNQEIDAQEAEAEPCPAHQAC